MAIFKMYMAISGAGKTHIAYQDAAPSDLVIDSDEKRSEWYGSVDDQTHNSELFSRMNKLAVEGLRANRTVHYVATNLNSKKRIATLQYIKSQVPYAICECMVVCAPIHICKERNTARIRTVPEYVIDRQVRSFQVPYYGEGWDSIKVVQNWDVNDTKWIDKMWKDIKEFGSQQNPHHSLTLYGHLLECVNKVELWPMIRDDSNIMRNTKLMAAAALHDIGKAYTKSIDEKGIAHYYGHEGYGAYLSLCMNKDLYISKLISYHMLPYQDSAAQIKWRARLGDYIWNDLMRLHTADKAAH